MQSTFVLFFAVQQSSRSWIPVLYEKTMIHTCGDPGQCPRSCLPRNILIWLNDAPADGSQAVIPWGPKCAIRSRRADISMRLSGGIMQLIQVAACTAHVTRCNQVNPDVTSLLPC